MGGPGREEEWPWLIRGPRFGNLLYLRFSILNFQTIADFGSLKPWTMQPVNEERPPYMTHVHKCTWDRGPHGAEWGKGLFSLRGQRFSVLGCVLLELILLLHYLYQGR